MTPHEHMPEGIDRVDRMGDSTIIMSPEDGGWGGGACYAATALFFSTRAHKSRTMHTTGSLDYTRPILDGWRLQQREVEAGKSLILVPCWHPFV
jgi:hypothetical protein